MDRIEFDIGDVAYIDGRDPQAQPPLTVGMINLWNSAERRKVVGKLAHGTRVKVIGRKWAGERWHYRVRHLLQKGWVAQCFLSAERGEPIGDVV